ncbi:MAG TPA: hypothetical protein VHV75_10260 [Solirubrobacteraceae bacterium]|jgi:hypothetical protein|nr:hypothetical protein [Solirubrobacteraceae bacterium]
MAWLKRFLDDVHSLALAAGTHTPDHEDGRHEDDGDEERGERLSLLDVLLPEERESLVGDGITYLLTKGSWVHRRTDTIRFLDEETIHRQIGVDFTLPQREETRFLYELHPGLVPIGTLQKRKLEHFGLWDESGRRIPMMQTSENGYFAAAALVALARGAADKYGINPLAVDPGLLDVLRGIASRPPAQAGLLAKHLQEIEGPLSPEVVAKLKDADCQTLLESALPHMDLARRLLTGPSDKDEPVEKDGDAHRIWSEQRAVSRTLYSMVTELADGFIVLAQLPASEGIAAFDRRIIKFAYEAPARPRSSRHFMKKFANRLRRSFEVLSWWPSSFNLDVVNPGWARSYHIEIEAPDGVELLGARILTVDPTRPQGERYSDKVQETDSQRAHLHVAGAPRAAAGPLSVLLRASSRGFLQAAIATAAFTAAALLFWRHRLLFLQTNDVEAAASLLLFGPTLVSTFLLLPGEHRMATRMLRGPRVFLLGILVCSLGGALLLAGDYNSRLAVHLWEYFGDGAIVLLGCLVLSGFMPALIVAITRAWDAAARKAREAKAGAQDGWRKLKNWRPKPMRGI